jgi:TolB-like protein/cytochrome c-type biogenesis protein CcmH/NrfG
VTDTPTAREDEGAWAKLRRRKVVQWSIAYAAGAWGLLQVLQFLADAFEWPSQTLRLATIALAIGLPIALTLAWYHGDRGHQKPVRTELAIIALLLLLGGGTLWLYGHRSTPSHTATTSATPTPAPTATGSTTTASVAVLPFTNLSADPANDYLADGIAETMITMLAQVPRLLVIGKNSSFSYKGKDVDSRTIGQQLGVGALLEGSVQRAGDRLRVAVQLVSTADGRHLWAETYDRPTTDVFAVQDDIAKRVTDALSVALAGKTGPGSIGTTNVAAYDAYLRGKQLVERRETKVLEEGIALLEKAVAADPDFARAWVKLSGAYFLASRNEGYTTIGRMPSTQAFALSERAARRAIAAAPNYGAAHAALGWALVVQNKDGYSDEYERAIALGPDDPDVIRAYAGYLSGKNTRRALKTFEPLLAREPRDPRLRVTYAGLLDSNGDIDEALAQYREAIRINADYVTPYYRAASIVLAMVGRGDLSLRLERRAANLDPDNPDVFYDLAGTYWSWGETELFREAQQALRRLGAKRELQKLEADIAIATSRTEDARRAITELLVDAPDDSFAMLALPRLRGTKDDYEAELRKITDVRDRYDPDRRTGALSDATVCLHAWLGHQKEATDELAHCERVWRSQHAFGFEIFAARNDFLARSLACVGRHDDALTELEALLNEGYNIGWRKMAVDPAYDAIRIDPRFKAVSDKLRAADAAAKARFRARPDLNDADIDSLGSEPIGARM